MSKTTTATASPIFDSNGVQDQLTGLYTASEVWLHTHWLQILIALAVGVVIVVALHGLRRLGERLCRRRDVSGVAETLVRRGWGAIVGRAIAQLMITVHVQLQR